MPDPQEFAEQPIFAEPLWLAGRQLLATAAGYAKEPALAPAAVVTMHSGRTLVQVPYLDAGQAETHGAYWRFRFSQEAFDEDDWRHLLAICHGPQPVYLIDFDAEPAVFVAGPALASFALPRPTAVSVWPGFAAVALPARAWLDGVELAETSAAPGAGEFRISANAVETATLTAGQVLDVRYYPAYQVAPETLPGRTLVAFGQVTAEVALVEARG
jgi:hypothetical protein